MFTIVIWADASPITKSKIQRMKKQNRQPLDERYSKEYVGYYFNVLQHSHYT